MTTYAIGDVQGCFKSLMSLMDKIAFNPNQDCLWFAGDLVNRGPKSLECLRFIKQQPNVKVALGNHDLHLIALQLTNTPPKKKDTFDDLMAAPDYAELVDWLRQQQLLVYDKQLDFCMTHAGVPAIWSLKQARQYAKEIETILRGDEAKEFAMHMYGNKPTAWHDDLAGMDRYRVITNYFSRMRFIDKKGNLELTTKSRAIKTTSGYKAWFKFKSPAMEKTRILFGHWASLEGITNNSRAFALDTGCVWGGQLTALCLENETLISVDAVD
ncbi:MAG: symmetrical bis(5'-nucleosyl)-tetraphosphatase [Pseudomonadales bacterium]|nr:symmetrical bis(5'-nucleosyl)-tetraphosphatase [Pseudomonadales bacterium]